MAVLVILFIFVFRPLTLWCRPLKYPLPHCQGYHTVQFIAQILPGLNAEGNLDYKYIPKIWVTGLSTVWKGGNRAAFSVFCMNNSLVSLPLGFAPIFWPLSWALATREEETRLAKCLRELTVERESAFPRHCQGQNFCTSSHFAALWDVCVHPHSGGGAQGLLCTAPDNERRDQCWASPVVLSFITLPARSCNQPEPEPPQPVHPGWLPHSQTLQQRYSSLARTFPPLFLARFACRPWVFITQKFISLCHPLMAPTNCALPLPGRFLRIH